jgi:hypothetical protein
MSDDVFRVQRPGQQQDRVVDQPDTDQLDGLTKVTGNIPPELAQRLKKRQQQLESGDASPVMRQPSAPSLQQFVPNMSSDLQELLAALKSQSATYEEITLPSLGRFYDGTDGPANGKLSIRAMTGEEEQILATPRFVKRGQAINMIFSKCMEENFKPENLLSVDRTFLLIYLRGISYGTEYEVEIKDPESDRKFSTVIDLDTLNIDLCPPDYGPELVDVLPKSGFSVEYRLSRGRDEMALQEYRDRKIKQTSDNSADDSLIFRTAQLVNSIQGITDKNELQVLLKNLPIQDVSHIRNLISEPPFGIDTKVSIISPISSEEFEVELPLEANFFFPRGRKKEKTQA